MRALLIALFSLSPLLVDVAVIAYALLTGDSNLAFISLWLLIVAVPACAVTAAIASATVLAYRRTGGTGRAKLLNSSAVMVAACALCVLAALLWWGQRKDGEAALRSESQVVEAFVASEPTVLNAIGPPQRTSIVTSTVVREQSLPSRYEVAAYGTSTIYAIVDVARSGSQRRLRLVCTTPIYSGQREVFADPCKR
jgi:hypothetical protein